MKFLRRVFLTIHLLKSLLNPVPVVLNLLLAGVMQMLLLLLRLMWVTTVLLFLLLLAILMSRVNMPLLRETCRILRHLILPFLLLAVAMTTILLNLPPTLLDTTASSNETECSNNLAKRGRSLPH